MAAANTTRSSPVNTSATTTTTSGNIVYRPVYKHWFYKKNGTTEPIKPTWIPFSMSDSMNLEDGLLSRLPIVTTNGGRFDVDVVSRKREPIYWSAAADEVRRCSWFYKGIDSRFVPYEEDVAERLEQEYRVASELGEWNKKLPLPNGETIVFHGPSVMVHFLQAQSPDSWSVNTVPVSDFCMPLFYLLFDACQSNYVLVIFSNLIHLSNPTNQYLI